MKKIMISCCIHSLKLNFLTDLRNRRGCWWAYDICALLRRRDATACIAALQSSADTAPRGRDTNIDQKCLQMFTNELSI